MSFPISSGDCVTGFGAVLNVTLDNSGSHDYGKISLVPQSGKRVVITDIVYSFAPSLGAPPVAAFHAARVLVVRGNDAPSPALAPLAADWGTYPKDVLFSQLVDRQADIIKPSRPIVVTKDGEGATVFISKCYLRDSANAVSATVQAVVLGRYESVQDEVRFVNAV